MKKKKQRRQNTRDNNNNAPRQRVSVPATPVLRFSPTAWAKLIYFRDAGDTEIGGFGITAADDLLYIWDFVTVTQAVTIASVEFDDLAVADFFDQQVELGRKPEQFARIWLHSHPGNSTEPSSIDEATFRRVFGKCDWAVMCIVAQNDSTYARLRFNVGPGGGVAIPVMVDYRTPFDASDIDAWKAEYTQHINPEPLRVTRKDTKAATGEFPDESTQGALGHPAELMDDWDDDAWWDYCCQY